MFEKWCLSLFDKWFSKSFEGRFGLMLDVHLFEAKIWVFEFDQFVGSNPKKWCLRLPIDEHIQVCSMFEKWCSIFDYVSNSFWLWVKHAFLIKWCFFTDMGYVEHTYIHGAQKRNGLYCFLEFVQEKRFLRVVCKVGYFECRFSS